MMPGAPNQTTFAAAFAAGKTAQLRRIETGQAHNVDAAIVYSVARAVGLTDEQVDLIRAGAPPVEVLETAEPSPPAPGAVLQSPDEVVSTLLYLSRLSTEQDRQLSEIRRQIADIRRDLDRLLGREGLAGDR